MTILAIVAVGMAVFLAMNIGANNSAAEMSAAYGAGVRTKRQALILIAVFVTLGALTASGHVIETVGKGLLHESTLTGNMRTVLIVMAVAGLFIFIANLAKVPIATTHAIICAIAGIGLYYGSLNSQRFITIVIWWLITPAVSLGLAYVMRKYLYIRILDWLASLHSETKIRRTLSILITVSGCYMAYSAGSNHAGTAMGLLVGTKSISMKAGMLMGGVGMALGALLLGGRVLETVGKGITDICIVRAILVELTSATIVLIASLKGIPVSLAEIVTMSIIGMSCAECGLTQTSRNQNVRKIATTWVVTPALAASSSWTLLFIMQKFV